MKVINLLIITSLLFAANLAKAQHKPCHYKTFERFLLVEKTGHRLSAQRPVGELAIRMADFEISCPWQLETDLNGDRKKDWVGLLKKDGKYSYTAYISSPGSYKTINIMEFQFFPEDTHIEVISTKELALMLGNKKIKSSAKFALVINKIKENSQIYAWDGKTLSFAHSYKGAYYRVG